MTRENEWTPEGSGYAHAISSPEKHRDVIVASPALWDLTYRLGRLSDGRGPHWRRAVYTLHQESDDAWHFDAVFDL